MSGFLDRLFPRGGSPADPGASSGPARRHDPSGQGSGDLAALERKRIELSRELAERQWDLGGVTYEMAIRDHFRMDVLVRLAAKLQQVDAELGEIERQLKLGEGAAAGECPGCRAGYSRGAVFCWSCGTQLMETSSPQA